MKFFSGFGFSGEEEIFDDFLDDGEYVIAGFSYGAQKALKAALKKTRVQKLILISPAIFTHLSDREKQQQIELFSTKKDAYMSMFYKKCGAKKELQKYFSTPTISELKELFSFEWKESDLSNIYKKGCKIEVHLGQADKIVDIESAKNIFLPYGTLFIKHNVGHILR